MAKDFTRSHSQPATVGGNQVQGGTVGGATPQAQTQPAKRTWQPQNLSQSQRLMDAARCAANQSQQVDREADIIEALKNPEFVQVITEVLKDRNEATLEAEEYIRHALRQIQSRDLEAHEKLIQCTPVSVQAAVKKLAVMGLSPNAEQGEGWLLPRWNKHASSYGAIAVPGVRGMERKLMETGKVANIESRAIFLQDHCRVRLGTENVIDHEVNFCPDPERPNPIVGSYGIITLKDGRREIAVKRLYQSPPKEPKQEQQQEKSRGYMDEETNARYLAQRPAMKGALNKFFKEDRALQALLEMENESYESAINREPGDIKVKVDPREKTIDIPLAQVGEGTLPQQQDPAAQQQPIDKRLKTKTEPPAHPVDRVVDQIRQEYENGRQAEPGVRV